MWKMTLKKSILYTKKNFKFEPIILNSNINFIIVRRFVIEQL